MIEVVSAVIIRNGRILLTQRRGDKDFPFTWECPGGKVDGNESHHAAILRELQEELGLDEVHAIAQNPIWCGKFENMVVRRERAEIFLLFYRVELSRTDPLEPSPEEGQGIGWFTADEMRRLTLAPGNQRALEEICHVIKTDMTFLTERPI